MILGSVGGVGGSIAILAVLVADGKLASPPTDQQVLGFISLGIVAGFLGFTLLKTMARGLTAELEKRFKETETLVLTKVGEAETEARTQNELNAAIIDALQTANAKTKASATETHTALARLEAARRSFPTLRSAGIISARLLRNLEKYQEAIDRLTDVLNARFNAKMPLDYDGAALLYNRACYRNLLADEPNTTPDERGRLKTLAEEDLLQGGRIVPDDLLSAKADPDLKTLLDRPRIKAAIEVAEKIPNNKSTDTPSQ